MSKKSYILTSLLLRRKEWHILMICVCIFKWTVEINFSSVFFK